MAWFTWLVLAWPLAIPVVAQSLPDDTLTTPCTIRDSLTTRPDPDGVATEISVGIYVINIEDIDGVHETFTADFLITLIWKDARVARLDLPRERCQVSSHQIWDPQVVLFNKRVARQEWEQAEVAADGNVWLSRRFSAILNSPLNLCQFPF